MNPALLLLLAAIIPLGQPNLYEITLSGPAEAEPATLVKIWIVVERNGILNGTVLPTATVYPPVASPFPVTVYSDTPSGLFYVQTTVTQKGYWMIKVQIGQTAAIHIFQVANRTERVLQDIQLIRSQITSLTTTVNAIQTKVNALEATVNKINATVNRIEATVKTANQTIYAVKADVKNINQTLHAKLAALSTVLNSLSSDTLQDLDDVVGNMTAVGVSLNELSENATTLLIRMDLVKTQLSTMGGNYSTLKANMSHLLNMTKEFQANVTEIFNDTATFLEVTDIRLRALRDAQINLTEEMKTLVAAVQFDNSRLREELAGKDEETRRTFFAVAGIIAGVVVLFGIINYARGGKVQYIREAPPSTRPPIQESRPLRRPETRPPPPNRAPPPPEPREEPREPQPNSPEQNVNPREKLQVYAAVGDKMAELSEQIERDLEVEKQKLGAKVGKDLNEIERMEAVQKKMRKIKVKENVEANQG